MDFIPFILSVSLFIFLAIVGIISYKISPARYGKNDNALLAENKYSQKKLASFVALRIYAFLINRPFRIFITDKYIVGAREGNSLASPNHMVGAVVGTKLKPEWQDPKFYIDSKIDEKYSNIDLESEDFLKEDKANFRILRSEIKNINYFPKKWGMGALPYSGRLVISSSNGNKTELILLGKQNYEAILKMLLQNSS